MKPDKAWVTVKLEIDMDTWDDDVDWKDPLEVFREQIECVGLRELVGYDALDNPKIISFELQNTTVKGPLK